MGSKNAKMVSEFAGSLSGNQFKVLLHIAFASYDVDGIPKGAKGRDGNAAQPCQFFGRAQDAALVALGRAKNPADALKLWERAVRSLVALGILNRVERAIPHKRSALYALDLDRLVAIGLGTNGAQSHPVGHPETGDGLCPTSGDERSPVHSEIGDGRCPVEGADGAPIVPPYLQALNSQAEKALSGGAITSGVPRRHSPSPETSMVKSPRARGTRTPPKADASTAHDEALAYLNSLPEERLAHCMNQARDDLGPDTSPDEQFIHAAQLAGWQPRKVSA